MEILITLITLSRDLFAQTSVNYSLRVMQGPANEERTGMMCEHKRQYGYMLLGGRENIIRSRITSRTNSEIELTME